MRHKCAKYEYEYEYECECDCEYPKSKHVSLLFLGDLHISVDKTI